MLPLVRRVVEDITAEYREVEPRASRYNFMTPPERSGTEGRRLKAELDRHVSRLDGLVAELHELGCQFKGFDVGLVDWYSLYAGRPVFLCWRLGEPRIEWWHQVDAGFAGRQPILASQREAFRSDDS